MKQCSTIKRLFGFVVFTNPIFHLVGIHLFIFKVFYNVFQAIKTWPIMTRVIVSYNFITFDFQFTCCHHRTPVKKVAVVCVNIVNLKNRFELAASSIARLLISDATRHEKKLTRFICSGNSL